jgi:hypothetical protein
MGTFLLSPRVLEALTLDPMEGSLEDSAFGSRVEIGMVEIRISPSNPRIGEMKLSKSCVQVIGI